MRNKGNRGITLIALVITIIVLLILAGVTIAMLTGENGILNQAESAKTENIIAQVDEEVKLAVQAVKAEIEYQKAINSGFDATKFVETNTDGSITIGKSIIEMLQGDLPESKGYTISIKEAQTASINPIKVSATESKTILISYASAKISGTIEYELVITHDNVQLVEDNNVSKLQLGDYINYDCYTGVSSGELTYISPANKNGNTQQTFTLTEDSKKIKWKYLGTENGKILITSEEPVANVSIIQGAVGCGDVVQELNEISKLWAKGKFADANGSRSINEKDINTITGFKPNTNGDEYRYEKRVDSYGSSTNIWSVNLKTGAENKTSYVQMRYFDNIQKVWKDLNAGEQVTLKYYYYYQDINDTLVLLTNNSYWLATNLLMCDNYANNAYYVPSISNYGQGNQVFWITGNSSVTAHSNGVRPVIALESNVKIGEKVNNVWQISK
ncbi:MAG: hypothetical protein HFJ40_04325 [Clostridia bacterium]|nr:hypothetical protein [Clostridia bacterium]